MQIVFVLCFVLALFHTGDATCHDVASTTKKLKIDLQKVVVKIEEKLDLFIKTLEKNSNWSYIPISAIPKESELRKGANNQPIYECKNNEECYIASGQKFHDEHPRVVVESQNKMTKEKIQFNIRLNMVYWSNNVGNITIMGFNARESKVIYRTTYPNGTKYPGSIGLDPSTRPWHKIANENRGSAMIGSPYLSGDETRYDISVSRTFGPDGNEAVAGIDFGGVESVIALGNDITDETDSECFVFILNNYELASSFPSSLTLYMLRNLTKLNYLEKKQGIKCCPSYDDDDNSCESCGETLWRGRELVNNIVLPNEKCVVEGRVDCFSEINGSYTYYHETFEITNHNWTVITLDKLGKRNVPEKDSLSDSERTIIIAVVSVLIVLIIIGIVIAIYVGRKRDKKFKTDKSKHDVKKSQKLEGFE